MGQVYTDSKIFHFPEKLEDLRAGRVTAPLHVRLKPTNRCAHRCGYCAYRNKELYLSEKMRAGDEIPWTKMQELTADLSEMGVRAVTLSGGGEPLSYPHIHDTVDGLLNEGIKIAVLTNGSALHGATAGLLAERGTWVRVSMDGADRETYAQIRDVGLGEFDRVCRNISRFAQAPGRRCVIGLNFIVTAENHGDTQKFLGMAAELGVDHVKVSNAVISTEPERNRAYVAPFYATVKKQIAAARAALQCETFRIIDKVHFPESEAESFERAYTRCPFAQCLTVIAADQNVYTCHDKAYTEAGLLGSIRDVSFKELWNRTDVAERLKGLDPSRECRHHCVHNAVNLMLLDYLDADEEHVDFV